MSAQPVTDLTEQFIDLTLPTTKPTVWHDEVKEPHTLSEPRINVQQPTHSESKTNDSTTVLVEKHVLNIPLFKNCLQQIKHGTLDHGQACNFVCLCFITVLMYYGLITRDII